MPESAGAIEAAKKKKEEVQPRSRPAAAAPAPAPKAPIAFTQWGLPEAAPAAAAPSQTKAPGHAPSGPAAGAVPTGKKKTGQTGSFPPMPSKAQQQVWHLMSRQERQKKTTQSHHVVGGVLQLKRIL